MVRQNEASPEPLTFTAWAFDVTVRRARALSDKILQSLEGLHHLYPSSLPANLVDALREYHEQAPAPSRASENWDRRGSPRFPVTGSKLHISETPAGGQNWDALEVDRSWRGFAFLSDRPCAVGSVLTAAELDGQTEHPPAWVEVKSCRPHGDAWVIGCALLPVPD
jgi:hypothetical protein